MRRSRLLIISCLAGLVILLIVAWVTRYRIVRYQVRVVERLYSHNVLNLFHDMDHCGFSEWITISNGQDGNFTHYVVYKVLGQNHRMIQRQHNLNRKFLHHSPVYFGDVDGDGLDEMLFFTYYRDSLFLFCGDPDDGVTTRFERFIDRVNFREDSPDFYARIGAVQDITGDGNHEVLFWVNAGFSLQPRAYYMYSWRSDTLIKRDMGYAWVSGADIIDLPETGSIILTTGSYSPQNVRHDTVMSDSVSWLVVLDRRLDFAFPPIPNPGYKTDLGSRFMEIDGIPYIYSLFRDVDLHNNPSNLMKFAIDGQLVSQKPLSHVKGLNQYFSMNLNDKKTLFISKDRKKITEIMPDLEDGRQFHFYTDSAIERIEHADIDHDGIKETICITYGPGVYSLHVYQSGLKRHVKMDFEYPSGSSVALSAIRTADDHANIAVQFNDDLYLIRYGQNPGYFVSLLSLGGFWIILSAFLYVVLLLQRNLVQKKYLDERKMIELELMTIKNQVDPHFLYNILNSVGSYILKDDRRPAYQYLVDFSNYIRNALGHTKDISLMLSTELQLVEQYLHLEQKRLKHGLDYSIQIDPELDKSLKVPRMIVQIFAENAIKHGLMYKEEKGIIEIRVRLSDDQLMIEVEDNGVGREKARQVSSSGEGMGYAIVEQIISLYNRLNHSGVAYRIEDLVDENTIAAGTMVSIIIPNRHGQ